MQAQPRGHGLVEYQLGVLVATAGEGHHEDPRAADPAALGVQELPGKHEPAQPHLAVATTLYSEMGMTFWLEQAQAERG